MAKPVNTVEFNPHLGMVAEVPENWYGRVCPAVLAARLMARWRTLTWPTAVYHDAPGAEGWWVTCGFTRDNAQHERPDTWSPPEGVLQAVTATLSDGYLADCFGLRDFPGVRVEE